MHHTSIDRQTDNIAALYHYLLLQGGIYLAEELSPLYQSSHHEVYRHGFLIASLTGKKY